MEAVAVGREAVAMVEAAAAETARVGAGTASAKGVARAEATGVEGGSVEEVQAGMGGAATVVLDRAA